MQSFQDVLTTILPFLILRALTKKTPLIFDYAYTYKLYNAV